MSSRTGSTSGATACRISLSASACTSASGFPLARIEGQVAFPAVLGHFASIEPTNRAPEWINSLVFRGMKSLPVRVKRH